ncbi:hypothetical protein JNB71_12680 [Rhizobium herbae]|uniref:Uncharacterized protein n=1 Tax=Rhizobium herbae TaxID=508661 RepID=A0ABS7HBK6_9HYPH|nr:hypothetical protein [Rhizobium herbae]MBW9064175.1 hypothetical protein [Rhizobium herbae]
MTSDLDFDPELFGFWSKAPVYDGLRPGGEAELEALARHVILDRKAESTSLDDLQDMLNGMTKELREQMQQFQRLREAARERETGAEGDIDRKLIQADAKASIEAMSLIVRTLEKIDSLQRTITHDRQVQAEAAFDEEAYETFVAEIELGIEARVDARLSSRAGPNKSADDDGGGARRSLGTAGDSPPGTAQGPASDEERVP